MPPTTSNDDHNLVYEMMSKEANTLRNIFTEMNEPTIELLSGPVTYGTAIKNDNNLVHEAEYVASTASFNTQLWEERYTIEHLTRHHLGLDEQDGMRRGPNQSMDSRQLQCMHTYRGAIAQRVSQASPALRHAIQARRNQKPWQYR